tara:strand:+ start:86 stop:1075 length:990 start_codon:yes stop_codon:yes gene_type:complete
MVKPKPQSNRQLSIDWLRGISIIGVLILHSGFEGRLDENTLRLWTSASTLVEWAVLAFFFASGLLQNPNEAICSVLRKRSITLLVPFVIYHVIYTLLLFALNSTGIGTQHIQSFDLNTQLLIPWPSPAFQLYFLPVLFVVMLTASIVTNTFPKLSKWIAVIIILGAAVFYCVEGFPNSAHGAEFNKWPLYFASFWIGFLSKGEKLDRPCWRFPLFAICMSIIFTAATRGSGWPIAIPPLLWYGATISPRGWIAPLANTIGQSAGSIYLWHTPILLPAITIALSYLSIPSLLIWLSSISLSIVVCIGIRISISLAFRRWFKIESPRWISL